MSKFYCQICGNPISALESIKRGYGTECAKALYKAKQIRVFQDEKLKSKYYEILPKLLIKIMRTKKFKSDFKKKFQATIINQETWLSKKQIEICKSILFDYDLDAKLKFELELSDIYDTFYDSIKIEREDIERARQLLRNN